MLGILDSGIGGLRIARKIMERLPDCDILYFGDTARAPYGDKSAATIIRYTRQNMEILLAEGAKAVVIVSHSIACVAGRQVRETTDVPVLDVVGPVVKQTLAASRNFSFGVIGSWAVADSNCYPEAILSVKPDARVYSAACPLLAPLVVENWLKKPETIRIAKKYLHPLKVRQIDTLILGGSYYTFIKKIIQRKMGKRVNLIDAGDILPTALADFLKTDSEAGNGVTRGGTHRFLVSDLSDHLSKSAKRFFNKNISLTVLAAP
jgi:glutamate racemase